MDSMKRKEVIGDHENEQEKQTRQSACSGTKSDLIPGKAPKCRLNQTDRCQKDETFMRRGIATSLPGRKDHDREACNAQQRNRK